MQLGLMVEPQLGGTYDELLGLARYAESTGLDVFARSDHYLFRGDPEPVTDAFASLAGLARDTERIQLCVLVAPVTFRHPAVMLKNATTIDEMSGGRFELGVGSGWMDLEHEAFGLSLPPLKERFERLEDALCFIREATGGPGCSGLEGGHYRLGEVEVLPQPISLPIIVGGSGKKKTPTLAGKYADEFNSFPTDPEDWKQRVALLRETAVAAGRDPDAILLSVPSAVLVGADVAEYRDRLAQAAAKRNMEATEYEAMLAGRGIPHGVPGQIREAAERLEALGIGRFYVQMFDKLRDIDTENLDVAFAALRG